MGFFIKGLVVIGVAIVLQHLVKLVTRLGYLKNVNYHSPGPCHLVPGIKDGSEDIQTLSNGIAILSSGLSYGVIERLDGVQTEGALYTFDFSNPDAGVTKISQGIKLDNPHGISLFEETESDKVTLFVVNHAREGERVEKLEYNKSTQRLRHIKSIADPHFSELNDVVAAGPDTFYVTNSYRTHNKFTQNLEAWFLTHTGSVVYYDGQKGQVVISGLLAPNGINKSPDDRFLYVASPTENGILVFNKISDTHFKLRKKYHLDTMPDNIDVQADNTLWIGAHSLGHKVVEYLQDPRKESPTQVLRLKMDDGNVTYIEEVYSGVDVSGGTIANYYNGTMLVGTVQTELMYCKVLHLD